MILVDTSVWIEHIQRGGSKLQTLLDGEGVLQHPFITGELACGSLRDRPTFLRHLRGLPQAPVADHDSVLSLLETGHLHGRGLAWVDVHLLASALESSTLLWTHDRAPRHAAQHLGVAA